jgi:hypothetical protein
MGAVTSSAATTSGTTALTAWRVRARWPCSETTCTPHAHAAAMIAAILIEYFPIYSAHSSLGSSLVHYDLVLLQEAAHVLLPPPHLIIRRLQLGVAPDEDLSRQGGHSLGP